MVPGTSSKSRAIIAWSKIVSKVYTLLNVIRIGQVLIKPVVVKGYHNTVYDSLPSGKPGIFSFAY